MILFWNSDFKKKLVLYEGNVCFCLLYLWFWFFDLDESVQSNVTGLHFLSEWMCLHTCAEDDIFLVANQCPKWPQIAKITFNGCYFVMCKDNIGEIGICLLVNLLTFKKPVFFYSSSGFIQFTTW